MRRSTLRFFAIAILASLGGPLAGHVLLHDLHHGVGHTHSQTLGQSDWHGAHEHPVISSPAPHVPSFSRATILRFEIAPSLPAGPRVTHPGARNAIAFGALRLDDDVGLQPLLSTFLI